MKRLHLVWLQWRLHRRQKRMAFLSTLLDITSSSAPEITETDISDKAPPNRQWRRRMQPFISEMHSIEMKIQIIKAKILLLTPPPRATIIKEPIAEYKTQE